MEAWRGEGESDLTGDAWGLQGEPTFLALLVRAPAEKLGMLGDCKENQTFLALLVRAPAAAGCAGGEGSCCLLTLLTSAWEGGLTPTCRGASYQLRLRPQRLVQHQPNHSSTCLRTAPCPPETRGARLVGAWHGSAAALGTFSMSLGDLLSFWACVRPVQALTDEKQATVRNRRAASRTPSELSSVTPKIREPEGRRQIYPRAGRPALVAAARRRRRRAQRQLGWSPAVRQRRRTRPSRPRWDLGLAAGVPAARPPPCTLRSPPWRRRPPRRCRLQALAPSICPTAPPRLAARLRPRTTAPPSSSASATSSCCPTRWPRGMRTSPRGSNAPASPTSGPPRERRRSSRAAGSRPPRCRGGHSAAPAPQPTTGPLSWAWARRGAAWPRVRGGLGTAALRQRGASTHGRRRSVGGHRVRRQVARPGIVSARCCRLGLAQRR